VAAAAPDPPLASINKTGAFGGFQVGYNWQFNQIALAGVEADWNGAGIGGTGTSNFLMDPGLPPGTSSFVAQQNVTWFGTVRGRLGWLPIDNLLLYGTGGFAYAHINENVALNVNPGLGAAANGVFGFSCAFPGTNCFLGAASHIATGWTAGGGLEYALGANASLRAEYMYVSLAGDSVNVVAVSNGCVGGCIPSSFTAAFGRTNFQVVRAGLNIRFPTR
jgi:outer membrane immunogenic protein